VTAVSPSIAPLAVDPQLVETQDRERQFLAYEIHDGIAQYLAGALLHLQAFEHAAGTPLGPEFAEGLRLLTKAAAEARRLIAGLRPPELDELGVLEAVESLVDEARADIPTVSLKREPDGVRVCIHDDGAGFDPERVPADRFGLEGMRQRARLLGAEPTITSRPGQGTTIEVVLPVPAAS
jgi:two-component system sensor histidine kinase UhpB